MEFRSNDAQVVDTQSKAWYFYFKIVEITKWKGKQTERMIETAYDFAGGINQKRYIFRTAETSSIGGPIHSELKNLAHDLKDDTIEM